MISESIRRAIPFGGENLNEISVELKSSSCFGVVTSIRNPIFSTLTMTGPILVVKVDSTFKYNPKTFSLVIGP